MNYNKKITIRISDIMFLIEAKSIRERMFRMEEMLRNLEDKE